MMSELRGSSSTARHLSRRMLGLFFLPCILSLSAMSISFPVKAQRLPGDYLNEFTVNYVTPHIPWARNWAKGSLSVFFLTPFNGAGREVAEVWERTDIQVFGETTVSTDDLGRAQGCFPDVQDTAPHEKILRLERKLSQRRYDVFVIGNVLWSVLPAKIQYLLLKQVADGAGLVVVFPRELREEITRKPTDEGSEWITSGVPLDALPFFARRSSQTAPPPQGYTIAQSVLKTYQAARGRVAIIDYGIDHRFQPCSGGHGLTPPEPFTFESPTYYEYYIALVIRAILWAGGKVPDVRLADLPRQPVVASLDRPTALTVSVTATQPPAQLRLTWTIKDRWGAREQGGEIPCRLGSGKLTTLIELPPLKAGTHFFDLVLDSSRGREDWASLAVLVPPPVTLRNFQVRQAGNDVQAFSVTGEVEGQPPQGTELRLTALDNYDRILGVFQQPVPPGRIDQQVNLPIKPLIVSRCLRLRGQLVAVNRILAEDEATLAIPRPVQDEYPVCMWGMMPAYVGHLAANRIRELGFNMVLGAPTPEFAHNLAIHDLAHIPYCTRICDRPHFVDRDFIEQTRRELNQRAQQLAPYQPYVYSLGDENYIPDDLGLIAEDQPLVQDFLRQRYAGDLAALNASWDTTFQSWEQVRFLPPSEARNTRKFAAHHDLMAFREQLYAQRHHDYAAAIKQADPRARVGAEGSVEGDLELTTQALDFWGPYRELRYNTLLRSIAPRNLVRGNWFGGYRSQRRDPKTLPSFLWSALFDGNNLIQYFALATIETLFNSDYSLTYYNQWYWDDFQTILDGPAQLIQRADYHYDPVALLHSQSSLHMSAMEQGIGRYDEAHTALLRVLQETGLQHRYVTDRHLGNINPAALKLLFLPCARALSDQACAQLHKFVEQGGILVADVRPAITDGTCRPRPRSALADLFGANIGPDPKPTPAASCKLSGEFSWAGGTLRLSNLALENVSADASVEVTSGLAMGHIEGAPVMICNRVGKGLAVLLNIGLEALAGRLPAELAPMTELVRLLATAAGVVPQVQALGPNGSALPDCRLARFLYGDTMIHGILLGNSHRALADCTLRFAHPSHLFDALDRKYLGFTDKIRLKLEPAHGRIICSLPDKPRALNVSLPAEAQAGAPLPVQLRVVGGRGTHLLRLHVTGPDNRPRPFYAKTIEAPDGRATAAVPFALNDPIGAWRLEARDVATGLTATAVTQLRSPRTAP